MRARAQSEASFFFVFGYRVKSWHIATTSPRLRLMERSKFSIRSLQASCLVSWRINTPSVR
jgi:hypothetical protein